MYNIIETNSCQQEQLSDKDSRGRERPWVAHKRENSIMAMAYDVSNQPEKSARLRSCADALHFEKTENGEMKLKLAAFCRVRLCPICQWRRSLKIFGQTTEIVRELNRQKGGNGYAYLMLTLTQKNIDALDIKNEISIIHEAWHRLLKRDEFKKAVIGSMRTTEITYNAEDDSYHPHIHAILAVQPSYFKSRTYIAQKRWGELWQDCARLDYMPIVHIQKCFGNSAEAIAEVSKYAAKPSDFINPSDIEKMADIISVLDSAVANRRFCAWGGEMAKIHKQLKLDDAETGDLLHTSDDLSNISANNKLFNFFWVPGFKAYLRYGE